MRRLPALIVLLGLTEPGAAQQVSSLQGRVVRWGSSEPIGRATVELLRVEPGAAPYVAKTAGDGAFVFTNVPPGQYRVMSTRQGYVRGEYGQRWPNGVGTPLTLPPGQVVSNVPIPMLQTGAISGVVRDQLGRPVGNAEVVAFKATYGTGRRVLTRVQAVPSDDRGEYRLFWLTPGRYFVAARHPELSTSPIRFGGISMGGGGGGPAGAPPRYQSFSTGGDNAASSRAPFDQSAPDREKYVAVYYPDTTDETAAGAIDVTPGGEARAIDFIVAPQTLHRVKGRVVYESNNEPAMSARVQWITPTGMSPDDGDTFMGPGGRAISVECCDGTFELGLPSGSYTLAAAVNSIVARTAVSVGDTDVEGVILALGRSFNIKGTMTFEGRAPTAAELAAFQIFLVTDPPVNGLFATGYSSVLPSGSFTVSAGRGDFRISLSPLLDLPNTFGPPRPPAPAPKGLFVKSIRLGNADVLNRGLHLDAETPDTLEIVIGTATGTLSGTVLNQNRQPLGNVSVVIAPDAARRSRTDLMKSTASDASGRFRIDGLPPGDYVAFAFDGVDDGEWSNPEFIAARESGGKAVRIDATTPLSVELVALTP